MSTGCSARTLAVRYTVDTVQCDVHLVTLPLIDERFTS
jgi:hypothetical protein